MGHEIKSEKIPAYVQVYNELYSDIVNQKFQDGSLLPSETDLSKEYKVSRSTLRQALAILNEDGLITKSQGKGTVVNASLSSKESLNSRKNPIYNLANQSVSILTSSFNYGVPTEIAKRKMDLNDSEIVLALKTTFSNESDVYAYSFTQVPTKFFKWFSMDLTQEHELTEKLSKDLLFEKATSISYTIRSIQANESDAKILNIEESSLITLLEGIFYIKDEAFARVKYYLLPDYYQITLTI